MDGLPPTIAPSEEQRQLAQALYGAEIGSKIQQIHPDYKDSDAAQMEFDRAVFATVPLTATLIRHPYESEGNLAFLRQRYEAANGKGSAAGKLMLMQVVCVQDRHTRFKELFAVGPDHPLYEPWSQGKCAVLRVPGNTTILYSISQQRRPLEIEATGKITIGDLPLQYRPY